MYTPDIQLFPFDYSTERDTFQLAHITPELIGEASFLDHRIGNDLRESVHVAGEQLDVACTTAPAFLFHTAFCGSTLLARALHNPPAAASLKEPQILLSFAMALQRSTPGSAEFERIRHRLGAGLALLARPWARDGRILIKPTNQANNLLAMLLELSPRSRALLLYSGLEDFLLSCCKKLPTAETRVRWMAQHLLARTRLVRALGISPHHDFSFVESCVLAWHAQMEIYADLLDADVSDRLRTLSLERLMAQPLDCTKASADWLEITPRSDLAAHVDAVFSRDSKRTERKLDPQQREYEQQLVRERFGNLIRRALVWADQAIAPMAVMPREWKALQVGWQSA